MLTPCAWQDQSVVAGYAQLRRQSAGLQRGETAAVQLLLQVLAVAPTLTTMVPWLPLAWAEICIFVRLAEPVELGPRCPSEFVAPGYLLDLRPLLGLASGADSRGSPSMALHVVAGFLCPTGASFCLAGPGWLALSGSDFRALLVDLVGPEPSGTSAAKRQSLSGF